MADPIADPSADATGTPGRPGRPGAIEGLWDGRPGLLRWVLGPLLTPPELVFRGVVALRDVAYRTGLFRIHPAPVPAISIGNLTVGGTGKTPLVRWLTRELVARGARPGILHGGYADDEPALLRQWFPDLPVVAERDRTRGAAAAVSEGATVLVLDDGFQHRRIRRDLDVVLVAAERWTRRPRLLPRGPYREPLRALARADVTVVTRRTATAEAAADVARTLESRFGGTTAVAYLGPDGWRRPDGTARSGAPNGGVAVAGIGRPDAFFRQVSETGVALAATLAFRDHHVYTVRDRARIVRAARGRPIITTAKDAVKLAGAFDEDLWVLDQAVTFDAGREALLERVEEAVA